MSRGNSCVVLFAEALNPSPFKLSNFTLFFQFFCPETQSKPLKTWASATLCNPQSHSSSVQSFDKPVNIWAPRKEWQECNSTCCPRLQDKTLFPFGRKACVSRTWNIHIFVVQYYCTVGSISHIEEFREHTFPHSEESETRNETVLHPIVEQKMIILPCAFYLRAPSATTNCRGSLPPSLSYCIAHWNVVFPFSLRWNAMGCGGDRGTHGNCYGSFWQMPWQAGNLAH